MDRVVLLNADYSFLNVVSWKRAICMIIKEKAEVLKYSETLINTVEKALKVPSVIKMVYIIKHIYKNTVPFTKKNLLIRDDFSCCYCGTQKELTIDHVVPKSRGGKSSFENCVTCCRNCNVHKKKDRTPREAGMTLLKQPYSPTIMQFLKKKMEKYKIDQFLKDVKIF